MRSRYTAEIAKVRFGSHLYGTNTPNSDLDYKSVHLPSAFGILLGSPEDVLHLGSKSKRDSTDTGYWTGQARPNSKDDVDHDSLSLAKFLGLLSDGDMNAIEVIFAPAQFVEVTSPEWDYISSHEVRSRLIDRSCKGFVGYCQGQATRYGVRASRIDSVRSFIHAIDLAADKHPLGLLSPVKASIDRISDTAMDNPHVTLVRRQSGHTPDLLHISVCGRLAAETQPLQQLRNIAAGILKKYGTRSLSANSNGGFDFPALAHAIRVGREAVELLTTGKITFPIQSAHEIVAIKAGKVPGHRALQILDEILNDVASASDNSVLRESVDADFRDAIQLQMYAKQIYSSRL